MIRKVIIDGIIYVPEHAPTAGLSHGEENRLYQRWREGSGRLTASPWTAWTARAAVDMRSEDRQRIEDVLYKEDM